MQRLEEKLTMIVPEGKDPAEDRLVLLCDGIFAIAITLLVLDIRLPEGLTASNFYSVLQGMEIHVVSYLITFVVIALYWMHHRRLMQDAKRLDRTFTCLTFLFLAFIAFFPATSSLLANYEAAPRMVVVIYTLLLSACGFSATLLWLYASWKHRLIDPETSQAEINLRTIKIVTNPLIYCLSLLLLPVVSEPYFIFFSWPLIGLFQSASQHIYKHWLEKPVQALIHHENTNAEHTTEQIAPEKPTQDVSENGKQEA